MYEPSSKRIHVLIALRDAARLKSYREFLNREGFDVTVTTSALECWVELECRRPDVLVLEKELPWGGGDGVLALIDDEPETRDIPVILLRGDTEVAGSSHPPSAPNREYLFAPPLPWDLAEKIHRFEERNRSVARRGPAACFLTVRTDAA
jgi:CheY-like chemotaxis protein